MSEQTVTMTRWCSACAGNGWKPARRTARNGRKACETCSGTGRLSEHEVPKRIADMADELANHRLDLALKLQELGA